MNTKHLIVVAIVALVIGLFVRDKFAPPYERGKAFAAPDLVSGTWLQPAKQLPAFLLSNHRGENFTNKDLEGQWTLMFFGFINCPDICPSTMRLLKDIKSDLKGKGAWQNKQVVYVTVDPERDTADKIAPYIRHFDKGFTGVTGDLGAISAFTKHLSMPFVKETVNEFGGYNVAHSGSLLVLNPQGRLAAILSTPHDRAEIVYDLAGLPFTRSR